ncbi:MAG: SUMF1/EgtB/PvdO family nonheme iron enzyme, partial [Desulfobacteraceae bacterium]
DEELDEVEELDEETVELDEDEEIEEAEELDPDQETVELDEDEEIEAAGELEQEQEAVELDEDEEIEEAGESEEDEELDEVEELDEETEEIDLAEDEDLEEIDELNEEERQALEAFRNEKELSQQFDNFLGEEEKKYNVYVTVPAGRYTVGTQKSLKHSLALQQIEMPEIYMARYPVTNSLFEVFVEQTGYVTTAEKKGVGTVFYGRFKKGKNSSVWKNSSGTRVVKKACWFRPEGPESSIHGKKYHPVVQVSIDDALSFAAWIGRRLPTEAEWEAAARTDTALKYPWGNQWQENACNIEKSSIGDTTSVAQYDQYANSFKIADLLGNVMEWTLDREAAPFDPEGSRDFQVAKGGGWPAKEDITISTRGLFKPGFTSNAIGFRCMSEHFI